MGEGDLIEKEGWVFSFFFVEGKRTRGEGTSSLSFGGGGEGGGVGDCTPHSRGRFYTLFSKRKKGF